MLQTTQLCLHFLGWALRPKSRRNIKCLRHWNTRSLPDYSLSRSPSSSVTTTRMSVISRLALHSRQPSNRPAKSPSVPLLSYSVSAKTSFIPSWTMAWPRTRPRSKLSWMSLSTPFSTPRNKTRRLQSQTASLTRRLCFRAHAHDSLVNRMLDEALVHGIQVASRSKTFD